MTTKSRLRQHCQKRRQALDLTLRTDFSQRIARYLEQFLTTACPFPSLDILCYQSLPSEVSTRHIFHQHPEHHYYAPVTHHSGDMHWQRIQVDSSWQSGQFQISEPIGGEIWQPSQRPSILICPLVGFDITGNRIGMGKGCFDRWLSQYRQHIYHIMGLAFSCQACDMIPAEPHDIALQTIITEEGIITCQTK